jgi:hypothetical protein
VVSISRIEAHEESYASDSNVSSAESCKGALFPFVIAIALVYYYSYVITPIWP